MWDKLIEYGKQLLSISQQVEENSADIKEISENLKELTFVVVKLANSNAELKVLFEHLKELEGSERDKIAMEWKIHQDRYEKDQQIVFLKLKNLIQENKVSQLNPEKSSRSRLLEGD